MQLNICNMYPDLLNAYGDYGNTMILRHRAEARGIDAIVHSVSLGNEFNANEYDIIFLGGGQSYEQSIAAQDLQNNKADKLKEYVNSSKVALFICGGYQLAGEYHIDNTGNKEHSLGILPTHTVAGNTRMIGNIVIQSDERTYVGFENHLGKTYIGSLKPLGTVMSGFGNNGEDKTEGCIYKNTYSTYMHGPFLSKNPFIADHLIKTALQLKYENVVLEPLNDELELKAKDIIIERTLKQTNDSPGLAVNTIFK